MKIAVISDIHGEKEKIGLLKEKCGDFDAVLFAGDFAKFEHEETGLPVLECLVQNFESLFAVLGNCDNPGFLPEIENAGISVEKNLSFFEGLAVSGSGGGSKFTGTTPFERTDEELASDFSILESADENIRDDDGTCSSLILIMHNPPKDTKCDVVADNVHVGSASLRKIIEKFQPVLAVTGHIHESRGIDTVGATTVINPGSLAEGKYALVELEKDGSKWRIKSAELAEL